MARFLDGVFMVRVLGPVDAVVGGEVISVKGRSERKLLAALAISANHVVSSDRLAQVLWGDSPPPSRDNTLQTHVSHLRQLLGHSRISGEDHSYALQVDKNELDALVFEGLVAEAAAHRSDPEQCLELCKDSISLWRGVPFGEFVDQDPFRLEAIRLDELRLLALELRLESQVNLGQRAMTIGTLESLVEEYPFRERLWYLLVVVLARSGRRVEAIRACSSLREVLGDVGLEPSLEMRELEDDILSEAPRVRSQLVLTEPAEHHARDESGGSG